MCWYRLSNSSLSRNTVTSKERSHVDTWRGREFRLSHYEEDSARNVTPPCGRCVRLDKAAAPKRIKLVKWMYFDLIMVFSRYFKRKFLQAGAN